MAGNVHTVGPGSPPRPQLVAAPFAFETESFRSRFVEERQAQSGFRCPAAAKSASPPPRRNFAPPERRANHRCPLASSCWRSHSTQPIAYSGCGGEGLGPRIASARCRVYSKMPQDYVELQQRRRLAARPDTEEGLGTANRRLRQKRSSRASRDTGCGVGPLPKGRRGNVRRIAVATARFG